MQLVAYGAQDVYLTGNPMITYFKVVYRRHTNFAMETIEQIFQGTVNFGNTCRSLIARNGDLIHSMYLEFILPHVVAGAAVSESLESTVQWTESIGHYLINNIRIEIGGQIIDQHYGDWLEIWSQLTVKAGQTAAYFEMVGTDGLAGLQRPVSNGSVIGPGANLTADGHRSLIVPLQFWFCRNVGLALPLIALQYHEVSLTITFTDFDKLIISSGNAPSILTGESLQAKLWVDYIYLDTDERRRFAQVSHEYLVEQLQFQGDDAYNSDSTNIPLTFNHPVKELVWVCRQDESSKAHQWNNYTNTVAYLGDTEEEVYMGRPHNTYGSGIGIGGGLADGIKTYRQNVSQNMVQTAKLRLNGHDRFETQNGIYFNRWNTRFHSASPGSPGINVFSFALKPEEHQPSGTCNFSRIDNARLVLTLCPVVSKPNAATGDMEEATHAGVVKVFATNYNVLRIMSGMGGLAYSN